MAYKKPVWRTIENPVEQNKFYLVEKKDNGSFVVYEKKEECWHNCLAYKIINSTLLVDTGDVKLLCNSQKWQPYGLGRSLGEIFEIDSWEDTEGEVIIKYTDEKGRKFVRNIDAEGNVYKKTKEDVLSV